MSDPTVPHVPHGSPDATPTQSLPLGDQQPAAMPAPAPARGRHTRTILEVVGGVVAVMMILVAGAAGFVVGHATGSDDVPRLVRDMAATGPWHAFTPKYSVRIASKESPSCRSRSRTIASAAFAFPIASGQL